MHTVHIFPHAAISDKVSKNPKNRENPVDFIANLV